jgi:hypothetical protein
MSKYYTILVCAISASELSGLERSRGVNIETVEEFMTKALQKMKQSLLIFAGVALFAS